MSDKERILEVQVERLIHRAQDAETKLTVSEARLKEADAVIQRLSDGGVNWIDGAYRGIRVDDPDDPPTTSGE